MTKAQIAQLVAILSSAYPRYPVNQRTCEVYEQMLLDLDFESTNQAIAQLVATSKWFPTVSEIREEASRITHGEKRLGEEAWGDIVEQIRRCGSYRSPSFEDPITAQCVRALGWRNLCLGQNDASDRARFVTLYNELASRQKKKAVLGLLPGTSPGAAKLVNKDGRQLKQA